MPDKKPRQRSEKQLALDEAYETLTAMFYPGHDYTSLPDKEKRMIGVAVRVMRGGPYKASENSKWEETAAPPPSAEEIRRRAAEYRLRFEGAAFTITALTSHWHELNVQADTIHYDPDETAQALITVFRLDGPADQQWPVAIAQRLRNAAALISVNGPVSQTEIERRATEFRRRFPRRDFTIDALADRWFELSAPLEKVSSDRTVSNYTDWEPSYPDLFEPEPTEPPDGDGTFDLHRWHQAQIREEAKDVAFRMLGLTRPHWAQSATPAALTKADPPYDPGLLGVLGAWVRHPTPFLVLYGPTGTGKTFIGCAIAYRFASNGIIPMFIRYSDLMTQIRGEWNHPGDGNSVVQRATDVGLLVLDELGATGDIRDWELTYFDTLLNNRLDRGRPTIITTNLKPGLGTVEADLEAHVGKRFASRFLTGTVVGVGGPDRRSLVASNQSA